MAFLAQHRMSRAFVSGLHVTGGRRLLDGAFRGERRRQQVEAECQAVTVTDAALAPENRPGVRTRDRGPVLEQGDDAS
ncbi:hypothetical protein ACWGKK_39260 [Streptomyces chartreusis]